MSVSGTKGLPTVDKKLKITSVSEQSLIFAPFFPVVILDRKDDPDSRDLVFSTQTLVRELVRIPPVKNKKQKQSQSDLARTVWTLRTSLRKLSLAKDIEAVPHL
jgi:hypothetical protein